MSHARFVPDSRRFICASAVLILHVGLIQVLSNGLSHSWTALDVGPLQATLIDESRIEPAEPPPPQPRIQQLQVDTLPMPEIAIDLPAESATAITLALPPPAAPAAASAPAVLEPPQLDRKRSVITPAYPPTSRRLGEEGRVVVNVYVLADGRVGDVQVLESSGYERLDAAALEHVRRDWRFDPARRAGEAVATWGAFGVTFQIAR
jgi:periplasmic protein TonB